MSVAHTGNKLDPMVTQQCCLQQPLLVRSFHWDLPAPSQKKIQLLVKMHLHRSGIVLELLRRHKQLNSCGVAIPF